MRFCGFVTRQIWRGRGESNTLPVAHSSVPATTLTNELRPQNLLLPKVGLRYRLKKNKHRGGTNGS